MTTSPTDHLVLEKLSLAYGKAAAVHALDLAVPAGQLVSLLGPSGCGKTTTMRAVAGLLPPVSGRIVLAGQDITCTPAHQRDIGLVFQSYALFPHLSAYENVAFGLRLRKVPAAELDTRVKAAIASVGLAGFEARLPANLSGGQQQRVAVARAIVLRPRLLLLDEPLSNLDARLRVEMRAELRRIQRELGITMLYVTHDQDEALSLSACAPAASSRTPRPTPSTTARPRPSWPASWAGTTSSSGAPACCTGRRARCRWRSRAARRPATWPGGPNTCR